MKVYKTLKKKINIYEEKKDYKNWYFFTVLYLFVDYCRPQDIISQISIIRPGLLVTSVIIIFIAYNYSKINKLCIQIKEAFKFSVLLIVLVPFAVNNYLSYITARTILLYLPFMLSVYIAVNTIDRLKHFIKINIVIMNYVLLYGIYNSGRGSGNYFTDENDIALYACMWIPFCFFLFISETGKIKIFYALSLFVSVSCVVVSFSRGGFVGLVVVFFMIWLFSPKKTLSLFIVCIIAIVLWNFTDVSYKSEMSTVIDTSEGTVVERLQSWNAAWYMFLDNPLGVGGNNFQILFPEYQPSEMSRNMWGRVAHSLWFTLIPEVGIFGIFIYLRLIYFNMRDLYQIRLNTSNYKNEDLRFLYYLSLSYIVSLAGFFAAGTFISVLYYAHYWYMTAYIAATVSICNKIIDHSRGLYCGSSE